MTKNVVFCYLLLQILCLPLLINAQECNKVNQTIVVKIGGSCLTDKSRKETLNPTILDWFGRTVAEVRQSSTHSYVLVHGAGSFGHFTAKEYGIRSVSAEHISDEFNLENQRHLMEGVGETRRSVQTLNQHVVKSLLSHKVPAVGLSPLALGLVCPSTAETRKEYQVVLQRLVALTLDAGLVPVLHGDACLYGPYGAGVLGGDTLMELLDADQAIFLTDVSGIFTSNPHTDPDARLVELVEIDNDGNLKTPGVAASESRHKHDVTGGLAGKLTAAAALARRHVPVVIVECGTESAKQALQGVDVDVGTRVVRVEE